MVWRLVLMWEWRLAWRSGKMWVRKLVCVLVGELVEEHPKLKWYKNESTMQCISASAR